MSYGLHIRAYSVSHRRKNVPLIKKLLKTEERQSLFSCGLPIM